jgi:uncharacterized membrane protein
MAKTPANIIKGIIIYLIKNLIFLAIFVLLLFLVWFFWGREQSKEKVGYFGVYERELPGNEDPIEANYLINGKFSKDWFSSALLYLVWKKYYDIEKQGKSVVLIRRKNAGKDVLPKYISDINDLLIAKFPNGTIEMEELKSKLTYDTTYMSLYTKTSTGYEKWFMKTSKFFEKRGAIIYGIIFGIFLFLSAIFFFLAFVIILIGVIIYSIKSGKQNIIFGRFTKEGRIKNLRWDAFKHYITDFSLMKEHPPASVIIWEQYMVYATAFGVAKEASKVIGQVLPKEISSTSRFNSFSSFAMTSAVISSIPSAKPSSSSGSRSGGGGGGFGGGGGGGGGGAR